MTSRGSCQISSFLRRNQQTSQSELGNLKLVEDTLDGLIKSCAQQLFDITDDMENAAYPFTTQLPHAVCSRTLLTNKKGLVLSGPALIQIQIVGLTAENLSALHIIMITSVPRTVFITAQPVSQDMSHSDVMLSHQASHGLNPTVGIVYHL